MVHRCAKGATPTAQSKKKKLEKAKMRIIKTIAFSATPDSTPTPCTLHVGKHPPP
jgi:hypothetical protein